MQSSCVRIAVLPLNLTLMRYYITHSMGKFSYQDIAAEIEGKKQTMNSNFSNLGLKICKDCCLQAPNLQLE